MLKYAVAFGAVLLTTAPAFAGGPVAVAGAAAIQGQLQGQNQDQDQFQGQGQGQSSDNDVNSGNGDTQALGVALGQAPTAVSGICGKGNKFGFGALEWTDFSSKCFNYMIAMEAAKRGEWDLTNQWVERADQM